MDEPRAECGDPTIAEEARSSPQDSAKMTKLVVTCGDVHSTKLAKKTADQSSEVMENLHIGGCPLPRTCEGPPVVNERELTSGSCKIDIEPLSVDPCASCVAITGDVSPQFGPMDNHGADLLYDLPKTSSGSQLRDDEDLQGNEAKKPEESSQLLEEDRQECLICTELYDTTKHKQSLLNCNHVFCDNCIKTMVHTANRANLCRVTCPICRQTTPMLEWEVRKMQEQMMESGGVCAQQDYVPPQPLVRRPGLCGALEYRFHSRIQTGRLFLFPPCIRNPHRLMSRLTWLEHRCRCLYLFALVILLFAEFFCFTFLFLPILIFILMIVLGK
ncbi:ring finger protein-like [Phyllobates terribilis]|uniref:ring finger protein-like n=1 Tax=Phyllobates terribilis TaxID=111132 RepID=UPI003CCB127A